MRKRFLQAFVFVITSLSVTSARAQFQAVYVAVNGLTCSQCSRTVELKIRKLPFVADVQMNLQHTEGKVLLKKDKKASMEQIAQAVVDAGFSVRSLQADLKTDDIAISASCFNYSGDQYVFASAPQMPVKGTIKLKFIGKRYMPKSELKKEPVPAKTGCGPTFGTVYYVSAT